MRPAERLALAIVLGLAVLVGGTAGAAAYAWHRSGTLRIAIHDDRPDGVNLALDLPGVLVDAAIAICPVPTDIELDAQLADMIPALRAVADHLAVMPDAVLVDVHRAGEDVRIAKSGKDLVIRVVSERERVEVTLPVACVQRLAAKLEAAAKA